MIDINELRDRAATFGSDYLTDEEWVEVIDRLDAAEKAVTEAYQRGYATGQEEIAAELEFAKREIANLHDDISKWMDKCDALRAKVAEMGQQEPVGVLHVGSYYGEELQDWEFEANQCACDKLNEAYVRNPMSLPLYALPGAQLAQGVPDDILRDAMRYRFLRSAKNIPISSKAARDPVVYDEAIDAAMIAAAPEMKP